MDELHNYRNEYLKIVANWLKNKDVNKWTIESLKELIFNPYSEIKQYKC